MNHNFFFACCTLLVMLCACNPNYDMQGMFNGTSPEVDTRFKESMTYNDSVGERSVLTDGEDYRIYVCTDTHIDSTHRNLHRFLAEYMADSLAKITIHLGDLINAQNNYPHAVSVIDSALSVGGGKGKESFFITPGNHDIYFNQWTDFKRYFNTSVYWFDTRDKTTGKKLDLFICLDSADGTLGTSQLQWLRRLLAAKSKENYRHIIVFTHTHMFKQDASQGHTSNYSLEETYEITYMLGQAGVDMYWCGHDHSREISHYAGTEYIIVDSSEDPDTNPYYMMVDMGKEIHYRFVSLKE